MIAPSFSLAAYAFALGVAIGGAGGWKVSEWKNDAAKLESERAAAEEIEKERKRGDKISAGWAAAVEVLNEQHQGRVARLRKELEDARYRATLPDSGRVLLDEAIGAANAARKSGATLPGSAAPAR